MTIERSNLADRVDMRDHIRQSNLIEGVDDPFDDRLSYEAWKWLVKQPRLNRNIVMQLHAMIMLGKLEAREMGHNRQVDVYIGGRKAPAPYAAAGMLNEWIQEMRGWKKLDPQEMHVKFEHIHPFVDGNGRTGRLLMWWHEIQKGQVPTKITYDNRHLYYTWFSELK